MRSQFLFTKISHGEKALVVKDLIMKLAAFHELNQTSLISFCSLNLANHEQILDNLERNSLIERAERGKARRSSPIIRRLL